MAAAIMELAMSILALANAAAVLLARIVRDGNIGSATLLMGVIFGLAALARAIHATRTATVAHVHAILSGRSYNANREAWRRWYRPGSWYAPLATQ